MTSTDALPDIVGLGEIAERLGVDAGTPKRWRARGVLPAPEWVIGGTPCWRWPTIWWWAVTTDRITPSVQAEQSAEDLPGMAGIARAWMIPGPGIDWAVAPAAPEWVHELVAYLSHEDDAWARDQIAGALGYLSERRTDPEAARRSYIDPTGISALEIADWLASHGPRWQCCDEAAAAAGRPDARMRERALLGIQAESARRWDDAVWALQRLLDRGLHAPLLSVSAT